MRYISDVGIIKEKNNTNKLVIAVAAAFMLVIAVAATVSAAGTTVKGHNRYDSEPNGYPDAGQYVNGKYTSVYAYDDNGKWYWDLGDGRSQNSPGVNTIADLDQDTLTVCNYVNVYRADFGNDAFMDEGWITNNINCTGQDKGHYKYLIVSETDPRYTGNDTYEIWGTWEYHVLASSGSGNEVRRVQPQTHLQ